MFLLFLWVFVFINKQEYIIIYMTKLDEIRNQHVNIEELPPEIHKELTVHKYLNELININLTLEETLTMEDPKEIKKIINHVRYHITKLVATTIHLFDWCDEGDIIQKNELRRLMEEYLTVTEYLEEQETKYELQGKLTKKED